MLSYDQEAKMQCPRCGAENRGHAIFCAQCGARLPLLCSQCEREQSPDARFCDRCGTPVGAPEVAEEPGSAAARALRRLAPREFAERRLATRGQVTGPRSRRPLDHKGRERPRKTRKGVDECPLPANSSVGFSVGSKHSVK
jgi:hypothetical protein